MKLYELANNYNNLLELLEDQTIEPEIIKEALNNVEGDLVEKVENICKFIRTMDAQAKALKEEEKRMADKRKSLENRQTYLKTYLFDTMKATGHETIKGNIFTLKIAKNPVSVELESLNDIPEQYKVFKVEADKRLILENLKNGIEIPGCKLKQGEGLRIR